MPNLQKNNQFGLTPIIFLVVLAILVVLFTLIIPHTPFGKAPSSNSISNQDRSITTLPSPASSFVFNAPQATSSVKTQFTIPALITPIPTPIPSPISRTPIFKGVIELLKERLLNQPPPNSTPQPVPSPTPKTNPNFSLNPASININKGCILTVDIILDTGGQETFGSDAVLIFDKTALQVSSMDYGFVYTDYVGSTFDNDLGEVTITGTSDTGKIFKGSGVFGQVKFKIQNSSLTNTQVKFDFDPNNKSNLTDTNIVSPEVKDIITGVTNGNYTLGTGGC